MRRVLRILTFVLLALAVAAAVAAYANRGPLGAAAVARLTGGTIQVGALDLDLLRAAVAAEDVRIYPRAPVEGEPEPPTLLRAERVEGAIAWTRLFSRRVVVRGGRVAGARWAMEVEGGRSNLDAWIETLAGDEETATAGAADEAPWTVVVSEAAVEDSAFVFREPGGLDLAVEIAKATVRNLGVADAVTIAEADLDARSIALGPGLLDAAVRLGATAATLAEFRLPLEGAEGSGGRATLALADGRIEAPPGLGPEPLLAFGTARIDLDLAGIERPYLEVLDLEGTGFEAALKISADNRLNWLDLAPEPAEAAPPAAASAPAPEGPVGVRVRAASIADATVRLIDASVRPEPTTITIERTRVDARNLDVTNAAEPAPGEARLAGRIGGGTVAAKLAGTPFADTPRFTVTGRAENVDLRAFAGPLRERLGLEIASGRASGEMHADAVPEITVRNRWTVANLDARSRVRAEGDPPSVLRADRIEADVRYRALPVADVHIPTLEWQGGRIDLRARDGALALVAVGEAGTTDASDAPGPPPTVRIDEARLANVGISYEDAPDGIAAEGEVREAVVRGAELDGGFALRSAQGTLARAEVLRGALGGAVRVDGVEWKVASVRVDPTGKRPPAAELDLRWSRAAVAPPGAPEAEPVLEVDELRTDLRLTGESAPAVEIRDFATERFSLRVGTDAEGRSLAGALGPAGASEAGAEGERRSPLTAVVVRKASATGGTIAYVDAAASEPVRLAIEDAALRVDAFDLRDAEAAEHAVATFEGTCAGGTVRLKMNGVPGNGAPALGVDGAVRNVDLVRLAPLARTKAGIDLQGGRLTAQVRGRLDARWRAKHEIRARDLRARFLPGTAYDHAVAPLRVLGQVAEYVPGFTYLTGVGGESLGGGPADAGLAYLTGTDGVLRLDFDVDTPVPPEGGWGRVYNDAVDGALARRAADVLPNAVALTGGAVRFTGKTVLFPLGRVLDLGTSMGELLGIGGSSGSKTENAPLPTESPPVTEEAPETEPAP